MRIKLYLYFSKLSIIFLFLGCLNLQAQQHSISIFAPTSALTGQTLTISGSNFSNITGVTIGGTSASLFTVVSATSITVTIPTGAKSGNIVISKTGHSNATATGFVLLLPVTRLITDFNGYWSSSSTNLNSTYPDNSHNLLAFEYNGTTYATGVSNATLTSNSVSFTNSKWQSLPVNNISGSNTKSVIVYATLADGSSLCNNPNKTIKDVLIDGTNGLNIGTGIANFDADLEFNVSSIDASKIGDGEPDILITQVADPTSNTFDTYRFINSSSTTVGNSVTAVVNQLPSVGSYYIDVYGLSGATVSNNNASTSSCTSTNTTRSIRLLALDLADFGITSSNATNISKLIITPGGTADYGFIAYNNASFTIPAPKVTTQPTSKITCTGTGTSANFSVAASSTGTTTYQWKRNGTNISGATNSSLTISNVSASDAGAYTVEITNSSGSILSDPAYLNSSISVQPESKSTCINVATTLSITAEGNSPTYQWYSNTINSLSGATSISGANSNTYNPVISSVGTIFYFCEINVAGSSTSCSTAITSDLVSVVVDPSSVGGTITGGATVCAGTNSTTLTLTGKTGSVSKWQSSATSNFSSPTDITSTATSITRTNLMSSTYYRAVVTSGSCTSTNSSNSLITVNNTYTWVGTNSTSFNTSTNWQLGCIPLTGSDITFTSSLIDKCVLGSNVNLGNITISGTSNKDILDLNGYALTVQGNFTLTGKNINAENINSSLIFAGSTAQNLPSNKFTNKTISNLTINNSAGVSLLDTTKLKGILTLSAGTLTTNDYLIFKSDNAYSAVIDKVNYSNAIIGKVTIEKYFPSKRAFRLICPSVTTTNSIKSNWQEGVNNSNYTNYPTNNIDPYPGFGTHITGSTTGANGFDATQTGNPSLYTYNNSNQTWSAIGNTNSNTFSAGTPYRLMIRGNRLANINQADNAPTPSSTILRTFGTLSTGNVSISGLKNSSNANNFIGNPYQCPVDMNALLNASTNLNKTYYYVWDPFLNSRGGYVTVDVTKNNNAQNSSANKYLQAGQSCFVLTSSAPSATPTFTFTENSKYTGDITSKNFFTIPNSDENYIKIDLHSIDSNFLTDATIINFNDLYSHEITDEDARKPINLDENIAISKSGVKLSVECRKQPITTEEISIFIDKYRSSHYKLNIDIKGLNASTIYLQDKFKNTLTKLNSNKLNDYVFEINKTFVESKDTARFKLIIANELFLENKINFNKKTSPFVINPNPIKNNTLIFSNYSNFNTAVIKLYNNIGQLLFESNTILLEKANQLLLPATIPTGNYIINFKTESASYFDKIIIN